MPKKLDDGRTQYTLEDLEKMPSESVADLMTRATKIEGTAVVRRASGKIKYDDPSLKGTYCEPVEEIET